MSSQRSIESRASARDTRDLDVAAEVVDVQRVRMFVRGVRPAPEVYWRAGALLALVATIAAPEAPLRPTKILQRLWRLLLRRTEEDVELTERQRELLKGNERLLSQKELVCTPPRSPFTPASWDTTTCKRPSSHLPDTEWLMRRRCYKC